jgi:hypothetical protein
VVLLPTEFLTAFVSSRQCVLHAPPSYSPWRMNDFFFLLPDQLAARSVFVSNALFRTFVVFTACWPCTMCVFLACFSDLQESTKVCRKTATVFSADTQQAYHTLSDVHLDTDFVHMWISLECQAFVCGFACCLFFHELIRNCIGYMVMKVCVVHIVRDGDPLALVPILLLTEILSCLSNCRFYLY